MTLAALVFFFCVHVIFSLGYLLCLCALRFLVQPVSDVNTHPPTPNPPDQQQPADTAVRVVVEDPVREGLSRQLPFIPISSYVPFTSFPLTPSSRVLVVLFTLPIIWEPDDILYT